MPPLPGAATKARRLFALRADARGGAAAAVQVQLVKVVAQVSVVVNGTRVAGALARNRRRVLT